MSEQRFFRFLQERIGLDVESVGVPMVERALRQRCVALNAADLHDYGVRLQQSPDEQLALIEAVIVPETWFFRYPDSFTALVGLAQKRLAELAGERPLRLLSLPCSTGEEPYSLAITACEAFGSLTPPVHILATDVDTQVLATGAQGMYPLERIAGLDPALKRRYFQRGTGPNEGKCRVVPALRKLIEFRQLNLLAPRYDVGGPYDALFCRNVMIYFDKPTQRAILSRLVQHMGDDGLLYTGHSENYLHASDLIQPCGRTLYRRAKGAGA